MRSDPARTAAPWPYSSSAGRSSLGPRRSRAPRRSSYDSLAYRVLAAAHSSGDACSPRSSAPVVTGARGGHRPGRTSGAAHDLERPARLAAERQNDVRTGRLNKYNTEAHHAICPPQHRASGRHALLYMVHGSGLFGAARGAPSAGRRRRVRLRRGDLAQRHFGRRQRLLDARHRRGSRRRRASRSARASRERCSSCFERK